MQAAFSLSRHPPSPTRLCACVCVCACVRACVRACVLFWLLLTRIWINTDFVYTYILRWSVPVELPASNDKILYFSSLFST